MTKLSFLTAAELGPMLKNKEISPVDLINETLTRIEKLDPELNSYITVTADSARKQAKAVEEEIMNGNYKGPLHGIPVGYKDNYKTKGIKSTAGAKVFKDYIPDETAPTIQHLTNSGVISLGKQSMHEIGSGLTGYNPHFGKTLNPWNTDYIPGGSSNGGSASLAAGLTTLATGTDTFGSIRVPSSMSGIYGLKPTKGLLSTTGLIPGAWSLDHPGPMARSVEDLAIMLEGMAGHVPSDPTSLDISVPRYYENLTSDIKGVKIGIPSNYLNNLDSDIEDLFNKAVAKLKDLGAEVKEVEIPELKLVKFAGFSTISSESSAFNYDYLKATPEDFGQDSRVLYLTGSMVSGQQYNKAQQARRKIAEGYKRIFKEVDLLVGPTSPMTTPKYQEDWAAQSSELLNKVSPHTSPANLTGIPSLAVPMGRDSNGLPAGMLFFGNHLDEQTVLNAGHAWQQTDPLGIKYEDLDFNQI